MDYKHLIEVTRKCNEELKNISVVPHQVVLVSCWETRPAEQIVQVIIEMLIDNLNAPKPEDI